MTDAGFSRGGGVNPNGGGVKLLFLANFPLKLRDKIIWTERAARVPGAPIPSHWSAKPASVAKKKEKKKDGRCGWPHRFHVYLLFLLRFWILHWIKVPGKSHNDISEDAQTLAFPVDKKFHFHAVFSKITCWRPSSRGLTPPFRGLATPLENPESTPNIGTRALVDTYLWRIQHQATSLYSVQILKK